MAENKVSVEITLEEKAALKALTQLTKDIQKTETSFKNMGDKGDDSLNVVTEAVKGVSDGFGSLVKGVTIANLASDAIVGTASAIKSFALDSINAAVEQEQAVIRLEQALKASNSFTREAVADLAAYSEAMAASTKHGDDEILNQIALAKSYGATNEQAKQMIKAAVELEATFGGSLDSRVEQLGKTLQGAGGKLNLLIPGFKSLTEEQLKNGAAFDFVNKKYDGAAASQIQQYDGKLNQLTKSFGELQEATGGFVTRSELISDVMGGLTQIIQDYTQKLNDSRIAEDRQKEGFIETADSVSQLRRKYDELTLELLEQEDIMNRSKDRKNMINPGDLSIATVKAKQLTDQLQMLRAEIEEAQKRASAARADSVIAADNAPKQVAPGMTDEDKKLVQSRQEAYAALETARADFNLREIEADVAKQEITSQNYAFELERLMSAEQMKIDAVFAAEEQKTMAIKDAKERQYALAKLNVEKEAALVKSQADTKKKVDTQMVQLEQQKQAAIAGAALAGLHLLASVAKDGSREQFLISRVAAIAQAAMASKVAYMQALAFPPGPPATIPTASWVAAAGVANVAAIAATSLKGFEYGGIVRGASMTGDNVPAMVNSGEMILNRQQQTQLFNLANGSGGNQAIFSALEKLAAAIMAQPINVYIDKRKIAEAVRSEIQQGFRLS